LTQINIKNKADKSLRKYFSVERLSVFVNGYLCLMDIKRKVKSDELFIQDE